MNGARSLIAALVDAGIDVCFANPGTSEMHFVAALDDVPAMRPVLTLFEGVATGAADGFARVTGRPACTLLHLGPGLANGTANLHNARRARTPLVNVVGDHATYHGRLDAPLQSDIESLARPVSGWYRRSSDAATVAADATDAVVAAHGPPGVVATLVLPADVSWSPVADPAGGPAPAPGVRSHRSVRPWPRAAPEIVDDVAKVLCGDEPVTLLLGGTAVRARGLRAAARVAARTGASVLGETFPAALERGGGLPPLERLAYLAEFAQQQLAGCRHLVLVGAAAPVSFFAYPDRAGDLVPPDCTVHVLATGGEDAPAALDAVAEAVSAPSRVPPAPLPPRPGRPRGVLTQQSLAAAVGALLPEEAVVVDESNTAGLFLAGATAAGPRHDWLTLTGGAIGQGMPVATGAAIGAPGRRVLSLQADGSAMYTLQALWTQAREGLDVTTILLSNRSYAILQLELERVGAGSGGPRARSMLELDHPELDFVALATGMGVPASRADTAEDVVAQLESSLGRPGPSLIEVVLPSGFA